MDDAVPYQNRLYELGLEGEVKVCPPRRRAMVLRHRGRVRGPSLEDTFAQSPVEAMACGLPVITTATSGTAIIMMDGVDGPIPPDPSDVAGPVQCIRRLYKHPAERERVAAQTALTATQYTWDRNDVEMRAIFVEVLNHRNDVCPAAPHFQ